jgi:hypothetical protein
MYVGRPRNYLLSNKLAKAVSHRNERRLEGLKTLFDIIGRCDRHKATKFGMTKYLGSSGWLPREALIFMSQAEHLNLNVTV